MKHRNPIAVVVLSLVTLGIYAIVWAVKTKHEMNARGAGIATAWWLAVPIANMWWTWKYCQGVELVSGGRLGAAVAFLLLWLLPVIGPGIVQDSFNRGGAVPQPAAA